MSFIAFLFVPFIKTNILLFLIPFVLTLFIDFTMFDWIEHWFFNIGFLQPLFKNLASKDMNVIYIFFFILYDSLLFTFILINRIITKKWHIKSIFVVLTISSYLMITLLFHYFLIEKNYRDSINHEMVHMEKVIKENNTDAFLNICNNQNYICAVSNEEIKEKITISGFINFVNNLPNDTNVKGNFQFGTFEDIFLIIKENNHWVIENTYAKKQFRKTENHLMLCLDVAHTFWFLFFIWLNLFHFRKRYKN
jgi:hypothetical protein